MSLIQLVSLTHERLRPPRVQPSERSSSRHVYSGYGGGDIEHSLKDAEELLDIVRHEAGKGWHAPAEQFAIAELRRITEPVPAYNQETRPSDPDL